MYLFLILEHSEIVNDSVTYISKTHINGFFRPG